MGAEIKLCTITIYYSYFIPILPVQLLSVQRDSNILQVQSQFPATPLQNRGLRPKIVKCLPKQENDDDGTGNGARTLKFPVEEQADEERVDRDFTEAEQNFKNEDETKVGIVTPDPSLSRLNKLKNPI